MTIPQIIPLAIYNCNWASESAPTTKMFSRVPRASCGSMRMSALRANAELMTKQFTFAVDVGTLEAQMNAKTEV